jgi:hypothetical protein
MVEMGAGFRYLVGGGDVDFAIDTTLPTQFRHFGIHVQTNHVCDLRPDQPKIAPISTAKI